MVTTKHISHSGIFINAVSGLSGGGSIMTSIDIGLTSLALTTGTYGSSTAVPVLSVDQYGRIYSITTANVSGEAGGGAGTTDHGSLTGLGDDDHPQYTQTGVFISHTGNFSNPHNVTASQVGSPTIASFAEHTGDSTVHYTQSSISISANQISDISNYALNTSVANLSGRFSGHSGDASIHFTQSQISITESQISNFGSYATNAKVDGLSGYTQNHINNTSNPHSVTAAQVGAPTLSAFSGHTGDNSVHFTVSSIDHGLITGLLDDDHTQYIPTNASRGFTSAVSGRAPSQSFHLSTKEYVDTQVVAASTGVSQALFGSHTGDSTVHFTVASIDHGLISGLNDNDHPQYTLVSSFTGLTGSFSSHTGNTNIHFTQAQISIPSSQISDISSYALVTSLNNLSGLFTGHSGNSSLHYAQSSISITASQISDFSEAADDRISSLLVGGTGINISYNDSSNILVISYTGATGSVGGGDVTTLQFTGHTGDGNIHFTQSAISITGGQVSDLDSIIDYRLSLSTTLISGHSGINVAYNDSNDTLYVAYTGNSPIYYSAFSGATTGSNGASGLVPAPTVANASGQAFLNASGAWSVPIISSINFNQVGMEASRRHFWTFADFPNSDFANMTPFSWSSINSGTLSVVDPTTGGPGQAAIQSSATQNSGGVFRVRYYSVRVGASYGFRAMLRVSHLANTTVKLGYMNTAVTSHTEPAAGLWIGISPGGTISGCVKNGTSGLVVTTGNYTTGSAYDSNTWLTLEAWTNDTNSLINYYVYDMSGTQLWNSSLVGRNLEDGMDFALTATSTLGSATNIVTVDYFGFGCTGTMVR